MKLRVKRVLNAFGHIGMKFSNRLGVIRLLYARLESEIVAARGIDDIFNRICNRLSTRLIYKVITSPMSIARVDTIEGLAIKNLIIRK